MEEHGVIKEENVVREDKGIWWAGSRRDRGRGVLKLNKLTTTRVSIQWEERTVFSTSDIGTTG